MIKHKINYEIDWTVFEDKTCYEDLIKCIESKTPFFRKVFQDWVNEKWLLLYEILGYTLYSKGYPFNKAIMLVGEGNNGKSTYLTLLKSILGSKNVKSIPLQEITSDKFAGNELYGMLANIYADLPNELLRNTGIFKILTGEDYVCFDRKYAKKRICFTNYAKLIFSCNQLPKVYDMTLAFWRRWIVIEFPNKFPDNPKFKEEIIKHPEIPSLIALSILAFKKVLERGKILISRRSIRL
jgi:Predicted ATPase